MAKRKAKVYTWLWGCIQFVWREVITHVIIPVFREPEYIGAWLPVETNGIAYPLGEYLKTAAIRVHSHNQPIVVRVHLANVARDAHRHVQFSIRAKFYEFPTMQGLGWKIRVYEGRAWRIRQIRFDAVKADDSRLLGNI